MTRHITFKRAAVLAAFAAETLSATPSASAASRSGRFEVSITIEDECAIARSSSTQGQRSRVPLERVSVSCTNRVPYSITSGVTSGVTSGDSTLDATISEREPVTTITF